jgi:hypothetical protein
MLDGLDHALDFLGGTGSLLRQLAYFIGYLADGTDNAGNLVGLLADLLDNIGSVMRSE